MSEPRTLVEEIERAYPATEGTLKDLVSVYVNSQDIMESAQAMMGSVEVIFADTETAMGDLVTAINAAKVAMESAKTAWDGVFTEEGADLNG